MMNYIFGLIDREENQIDQTSLDDNDPAYALGLFVGEFGYNKLEDHTVELVRMEEE